MGTYTPIGDAFGRRFIHVMRAEGASVTNYAWYCDELRRWYVGSSDPRTYVRPADDARMYVASDAVTPASIGAASWMLHEGSVDIAHLEVTTAQGNSHA